MQSDNLHDIRRSLVASYMHLGNDKLEKLDMKADLFIYDLHKLMITAMTWMLSKDIEITEDTLLYYISKNNEVDTGEWLQILATMPFSTERSIRSYQDVLIDNKMGAVFDL